MRIDRLRITLALVIVGGYILILGIVIIAIVFTPLTNDEGINIIEEASKVLPGFIGMIVGFYFSRGSNSSSETSPDGTDTSTTSASASGSPDSTNAGSA